mgnify:FL=1
MKKLTAITLLLSLFIGYSCKQSSESKDKEDTTASENSTLRIVTLNGALTETISALGYEEAIVGVDVTSTFPKTVKETATDLGHISSITIESIMALKPTDVFATEKDLSPDLKTQLESASVNVHLLKHTYTIDGTKALITDVAKVLEAEGNVEAIFSSIDTTIDTVEPLNPQPKVVFIYARGAGTLMLSGNNTPMQQLVALAGGEYAITEFDSFKPLTPESLVQANPDVLFLFESGIRSLGGAEGLLTIPGVAETNAAKDNAIITMDGALVSSFGPRVGLATKELNELLKKHTAKN